MKDFYKKHKDDFKFAWEVELMVTDDNYTPLFGDTLPFDRLQDILNSVPVNDIPYVVEKYKGSGVRPYYIEGYDAGYEGEKVRSVFVKGIEIRTPISFTINDSVQSFATYYDKMQTAIEGEKLHLTCFGNHPFQPAFKGERGRRSVIEWTSAEVATTTHGLVVNISLPDALEAKLDRQKLDIRFSYAAPTMVLFAGNTPFRNGELWKPDGRQAYSDRSYRRSFVRNTVYYRDEHHNRKEVTLFDMTNDLNMYRAFAALSLGIILSDEEVPVIPDRFSKENIRRVTKHGYDAQLMNRHFEEAAAETVAHRVLDLVSTALKQHGFDTAMVNPLWKQVEEKEMPAHRTIQAYNEGGSIQSVLKSRSQLIRLTRE